MRLINFMLHICSPSGVTKLRPRYRWGLTARRSGEAYSAPPDLLDLAGIEMSETSELLIGSMATPLTSESNPRSPIYGN